MTRSTRFVTVIPAVAAAVGLTAVSAAAQDEAALKKVFEGQRVTVRIDMPGAADGVDVQADTPGRSLNQKDYTNDLRRYGVAIRSGDGATVTLIKLKKDLIEFQLDGGGF